MRLGCSTSSTSTFWLFHAVDQEKIHASAIRSGTRRRIDWFNVESCAQNFCGAVHIRHVNLYLLNSFVEFFEKTRDRATSARRFCREDVQAHIGPAACCKFKLEFHYVLIGRRVGERRRSIGRANFLEGFRQYGDPDGDSWRGDFFTGRLHVLILDNERSEVLIFAPLVEPIQRACLSMAVEILRA